MKLLRITFLVFPLVLIATTAWGQFGMYGAPELVSAPRTNQAAVPYGVYTMPSASAVVPATAPLATPVQAAVANRYAGMPVEPAPPMESSSGAAAPAKTRPASSSGAVGLLLNESNCVEPGYCREPTRCGEEACGEAACGEAACGGVYRSPDDCPWYASTAALYMIRNQPNMLFVSSNANQDEEQPGHNRLVMEGWGGEIRFGRRFCCGCSGHASVEAVYWGLEEFTGSASYSIPGGQLNTPLIVSGIEFGGINGTAYFDGAEEHRVRRSNQFHNVELNLLRRPLIDAYGLPWDINWMIGIRYFRFKERFIFGSRKGPTWGANGGMNEAYLDDDISNDLLGGQLGFDANYRISDDGWRFFASPKLAICGNYIDNYFQAYRGDGTVANPTVASGQTGSFPVSSSKTVLSFLGQVDVGVEWQFAARWGARIGYRLVVVTDVGLADNQIPPYVADIPEITRIDHNANLILHGGFAGLTYNF